MSGIIQRPGTAPKRPASPGAQLTSASTKVGSSNDFTLGVLTSGVNLGGSIKGSKFLVLLIHFKGADLRSQIQLREKAG